MSSHKKIIRDSIGVIPPYEGKYIQESFALQKLITFSFGDLDLDRGKFSCGKGRGDALITVLHCLRLFSGYNQIQMGTTKNYHPLDDDIIKKNSLQDLQQKSPNKKLHQMGKKHNSERIVGFFDKDPNNLFHVCILDLDHQICPMH